jgi:hypothetical protein
MGSTSMNPRSPNAVLFTRAQCNEEPCGCLLFSRGLWYQKVVARGSTVVGAERVEPRGIEPLTSALAVRLEAVAVVRGCCRNRSFKPIS